MAEIKCYVVLVKIKVSTKFTSVFTGSSITIKYEYKALVIN